MVVNKHHAQKINNKLVVAKKDAALFQQQETGAIKKAIESFFWIKIFYASLILLSAIAISISSNSTLKDVLTVLIVHLALAITIDNFGEKYAKQYQLILTGAK